MPATPETLLIACIHSSLAASRSGEVANAADRFRDWPAFMRISEAHGLLPFIAGCLDSACVEPPPEVRAALYDALYQNAKRVLVMSEELHRVLRLFDAAGIPVLTVKGPVIAWSLYQDPAYRAFSDLDLLVPPDRVTDAQRVLSDCGYAPSVAAQTAEDRARFRLKEVGYANARSGIRIDLHWMLTPPNWFAAMAPGFCNRTRIVMVGDCAVRTLGEEDTLLHLCFHGAQHGWSDLNWLVDVCNLIVRSPGIGRRTLDLLQPTSTAAATVHFGLAASAAIAPDIPQFREELPEIPRHIRDLAQILVGRAVHGEITDDSALSRCRFQWQLGGSRLAMSRYILQWILTPDQTDRDTLPAGNHRRFFLLVPWRLLRLTRRALAGTI